MPPPRGEVRLVSGLERRALPKRFAEESTLSLRVQGIPKGWFADEAAMVSFFSQLGAVDALSAVEEEEHERRPQQIEEEAALSPAVVSGDEDGSITGLMTFGSTFSGSTNGSDHDALSLLSKEASHCSHEPAVKTKRKAVLVVVWVRFTRLGGLQLAYESLYGGELRRGRAGAKVNVSYDPMDENSRRFGKKPPPQRNSAAREGLAIASYRRFAKETLDTLRELRDTIGDHLTETKDDAAIREAAHRALVMVEEAVELCDCEEHGMKPQMVTDRLSAALKTAKREARRVDTLCAAGKRRCEKQAQMKVLETPLVMLRRHKALAPHCAKFAACLAKKFGDDDPALRGVTLIVPNDGAFLGEEDGFEDECWGVHIIDAPYQLDDLNNFDRGRIQPRHADPRHALRFRRDTHGHPRIWLDSDSLPPRTAQVLRKDIRCRHGTIIHLVDRIMYPDG